MSGSACFAVRGVIEGFYGTPWTHEERLDMIDFLHRYDYNAYFYAPKDDEYLRERWMEPLPAKANQQLDELIQRAKTRNMQFIYCLGPGLSMEYTNRQHLELLGRKYRDLYDRGVRYFALLFDDIPMHLLHDKDVAEFAHLAEAHAHTTLYVWDLIRSWGDPVKLVVCPTQYNGIGKESYIMHLGQHLPPEIDLFWTGRFVCSPYLTDGDAIRFQAYTGHQPFYWDNYPVNDLAMANELHIGPLRHRDPDLWQYAAGYVANAMSRPECSKIPLITTAAYLRDPIGYDPDMVWKQAVEEVAGQKDADAFFTFADNVQSSFLCEVESPRLLEAILTFRFHFLQGDRQKAIADLTALFQKMEAAADKLLAGMTNQKLAEETRPWVEKFHLWTKVGLSAVALIDHGTRGRLPQAAYHLLRLKQWLKRTERYPQEVCGPVMQLFVDAVMLEVKKNS